MSIHKSVLLKETVENLNLGPGKILVDATFGGGGHSEEACKKFPGLTIYAYDQDLRAIEEGRSKFKDLEQNCNITFFNQNFREIDLECSDAIIFDLGLSSDQLENSGRGFTFKKDEPLLMTMKENPTEADLTARDVVNTWSEESLADIIYGFGEERYARRIAKAIVEHRVKEKIEKTSDLVRVIESAVPSFYRHAKIHFATRTFQALRIAVNDELGALEVGMKRSWGILNKEGRLAVISFHSLEDRIVKKFFKEKVVKGEGKLINKKPITAGEAELKENPRARSAKLRIIEKIV
jgi:16S rRNA (cytosine1402-N4)-methyltransferase